MYILKKNGQYLTSIIVSYGVKSKPIMTSNIKRAMVLYAFTDVENTAKRFKLDWQPLPLDMRGGEKA